MVWANNKFIKSNYKIGTISSKGFNKKNDSPQNSISHYAASNTVYTQPHFYSPLHTPQNWQIPSRREEIYQWARFFFENEPKVAAAIQFYSEFPMQGFELQCSESKIKRYFEELNKRLKLEYWLPIISSEYFLLGDVFPFLGIECKKCKGTGFVEGKECEHEGGTFNKLVILNPDWIQVKQNVLADEPFIQLLPNDELRKIVMDRNPKELYERIPDYFRKMIMMGRPIPLSNKCVTHLKFMPSPNYAYGMSLIRRLFKILAYKDRLMTANWIIAERLILPIRIIKIGNDDRPAGAVDIANVQEQMAAVMNDPNLILVTHHAFDYSFVGAQGAIVQTQQEYEMINKDIQDGLMLPQAVLTSEMQGYQGVQIGAEILISRLEKWRREVKDFIELRIYEPVAKMQGFVDKEASEDLGETVYVYPKIKWNDLKIRDDTQRKQQYLGLHDAGIISTQTLTEIFDLDYDQEIERKREEANIQMTLGGGGMMGGGMPGMPGGAGGGMPPMGGAGGGLGGGMPPPGAGGGAAGPAGAGPSPMGVPGAGGAGEAGAAVSGGTKGKILKRKTKNRIERKSSERMMQQSYMPQQIQLTSIEKILWRKLFNDPSINIPYKKFAQYKVANAGGGQPYIIDFAIPELRLAIEADGELHKIPENKARDEKRDKALASKGWAVLRFEEREIQNKIDAVMRTIMTFVNKRSIMLKKSETEESKINILGSVNTIIGSLVEE